MDEDFDESILDNEEEFNKRFKRIDRKDIPIAAINKSLKEARKGHSEEYFGDFRDYWYNLDFLELMAKRWELENVNTLLDVGCGQCHWTRIVSPFLKKGSVVTAVDFDPKWARENNKLREFFNEGEIDFEIKKAETETQFATFGDKYDAIRQSVGQKIEAYKSELKDAVENQNYYDVSTALMYLVSGRK